MKHPFLVLNLFALTACSSGLIGEAEAQTYQAALTHDVSFTQYAVTTRVILRNDGGCDELSGGWVDDANINNLLFLGQSEYQKWVKPGHYVMDGVGMALFWNRSIKFVFACKNNGAVTYHQTEEGFLNEAKIRQNRVNLVLSSKAVNGQVVFSSNYPFQ